MSLTWQPRYEITCDCPRCLAAEKPISIRNPYENPSRYEEIYIHAERMGWTIDREANHAIAPNNLCEQADAEARKQRQQRPNRSVSGRTLRDLRSAMGPGNPDR